MARRLTYRAAGVDVGLKERLVPRFRQIARATLRARSPATAGQVKVGVLGGIGGFGALMMLDGIRRMRSPVVVAGTDGVGTKLKIAFATGRHNTVGIDCVAMCVNDIACYGAQPLFFLDYIATGQLDPKIALQIVQGLARGCRQAGMALVGGETAQMPGFYKKGEYDLAGFAVGVAERKLIPSLRAMKAGDILVGLASDGLHSNGYSLARKVLLQRARLRLDQTVDDLGCPLADELLRPTRIYAPLACELFHRFAIKGLAHITGGGIVENLPRVMPDGLCAQIERASWSVPPIFSLIERLGNIARGEMDRTFNNGLGMIAIVGKTQADAVLNYLRSKRQRAWTIGQLVSGRRGVRFV